MKPLTYCVILLSFLTACKENPCDIFYTLGYSACIGDLSKIKLILEENPGLINKMDYPNGYSLLHIAAENGNYPICDFLISKGANINAQAHGLITPLHLAAKNGNKEVVEYLIKKGANVNSLATDNQYSEWVVQKCNCGDTPLHFALKNGHEEVAYILINNEANINILNLKGDSPLDLAIMNEHYEMVVVFLNIGFIQNPGSDYSRQLREAVETGNKSIIKLFLNDANLIKLDDDSINDALLTAAGRGDDEICELLINYGANVNYISHLKSGGGLMPKEGVVTFTGPFNLFNFTGTWTKGEEINLSSGPAICLAAEQGHEDVIKLLISNGSKINPQCNDEKSTPYKLTINNDHKEAAKILLRYGGK